jgi:hypothetical protein
MKEKLINYLLSIKLHVFLYRKLWMLDAKQAHELLNEPFSLSFSKKNSLYVWVDDVPYLPLSAINTIIKDKDFKQTLFSVWFQENFHDFVFDKLNVVINKLSKEQTVKSETKTPSISMKDLPPEHRLFFYQNHKLRIWLNANHEIFVNTTDLTRLLGINSSNFTRKHSKYLAHPFDRFITSAYRQATTYTSIRLLATLEQQQIRDIIPKLINEVKSNLSQMRPGEVANFGLLSESAIENILAGKAVDEYGYTEADYKTKGDDVKEFANNALSKTQADLIKQLGF